MRLFRPVLFLLAAVFFSGIAKASHIYGADFFYEHVSGNTYRISLVVYGDCAGVPSFKGLQSSVPVVSITENGVQKANINLFLTGPGVEVTPICQAFLSQSACQLPGNPLPGVKRYTYTGTYNVTYASTSWVFRYTGNMGATNPQAGRSTLISNIGGGTVMSMEATLNNTNGPNSSPKFTSSPTPFYCVNIPQQYNQGAVDPDKDSLIYALVPGLASTGGTVGYQLGFSAAMPLATATGSFSFSPVTGQLAFTPNTVQQSLVVNEVTEYRNGVIVGTASREMTFVVIGNCNNVPPSGNIDTSAASRVGGVASGGTAFNIWCI